MTDEPKAWDFPVARIALGALGFAADLVAVTAEAVSEGCKTYSAGVKDLRSTQK